jgi:hypothetical protein
MSATPILDLEQPPPKPPAGWRGRAGRLAIGAALGVLIELGEEMRGSVRWPVANGWLILPAFWLAVAIHELGHLAAAKLVGLDAGGLSIGPLMFLKSGGNLVFRCDWRRWAGGFFKPLTVSADLNPAPFAWSVAGGPLASLALTGMCGLLQARYGDGNWQWIGTLSWAALGTVLLSVIPFSVGVQESDGARLWQLIRRPKEARPLMALLGIQTEEAQGLLPREWDPQRFEEMLRMDRSAGEYFYCELLGFYRRFDEGSEAEALQHLENALASSAHAGTGMRYALFLEAVCASALIQKRAERARAWRARAAGLRKSKFMFAADAALARCEGRPEEALRQWTAARARVDRLRLDSGLIRFAKAKWAECEAECRSELQNVAPTSTST